MPDEQQQPATKADLQALQAGLEAADARLETRLLEAMRDMQTEILRGLERFARGNFARLHTLDTAGAAANERLAALEERVLALETRTPPR